MRPPVPPSTATILASAHLGFGLSTTHVSTGGILGSGVGRKGAEVRWSVARKMLVAWLLTLPGAALVGGLAALLAQSGTWRRGRAAGPARRRAAR